MCIAFLSACDKPAVDNPEVTNNPEDINEINVNDVNEVEDTEVENNPGYIKESLNNEDLSELEQVLLPVSHKYEKYTFASDWLAESGEYTYSEWSALLPIIEARTSRDVQTSDIQDGMIYTNTLVTMWDGKQYSVLYVNNPNTLEFVAASVSDDESTVLYSFRY